MSEDLLRRGVDALVVIVEAAGAVVIGVGAVTAFVLFVIAILRRDTAGFVKVRLLLGRFLALGLEFQLASDVLTTAVAPTFEEIGKLAAIAAIRTALNYFLAREIKNEREELQRAAHRQDSEPPA